MFIKIEEDYLMEMEMVRDKTLWTVKFILNLIMGLKILNQVKSKIQADKISFICYLKQCNSNSDSMTLPVMAF